MRTGFVAQSEIRPDTVPVDTALVVVLSPPRRAPTRAVRRGRRDADILGGRVLIRAGLLDSDFIFGALWARLDSPATSAFPVKFLGSLRRKKKRRQPASAPNLSVALQNRWFLSLF